MAIYGWNMYWICTLNYINVSIVKSEEGYLLVYIDGNKVILWMDSGLCIVPVRTLCFMLQNKRVIFSEVAQNHKWHFSSLRNIACCVAMNEWWSRSSNFSSNDSVSSSVDFTMVTNSHLSVEIHCFKVMFSIALSVNTSSNVFSKLVGPGHSLQSREKN
jgi:hypothetical protein